MNIYLWEDVLEDFTPGMMMAIAPDVETARKMLRDKYDWSEGDDVGVDIDLSEEPKVLSIDEPFCLALLGGS